VISYPAVASMVGVVSHEQLKHTVFLQSAWLCIPQEVLAIPNIWDMIIILPYSCAPVSLEV